MSNWQRQWQESFKSIHDLLDYLNLSEASIPTLSEKEPFPLRVPRPFADRMEKGNPYDPLLLQVLPLAKESKVFPGYQQDPLAEKEANPIPGLLHKYHGRVLLTLTGACAVHCRYCFRRHFPYNKNNPGKEGWQLIFDYLRQHPEVNEVILSGGDPLSLSDDLLASFLQQLSDIESVSYLRFHTRFPMMIPSRITPDFVALLASLRFRTSLVFHSNHAREWDDSLQHGVDLLRASNIILLNQAVLLRQVNDSAKALIDLSYRLYDVGVLPYYLHLLDKVSGAQHFEVSQARGVSLMQELIHTLPGYLVPKMVYEAPGCKSKIPVDLDLAPRTGLEPVTQ